MTAPVSPARTTCASIYWRSVVVMGASSRSPLCDGDRIQAYRLAQYALSRVGDTQDPSPRIAACTAAFLQNREADDGGGPLTSHWVSRVVYAFSTGIFNLNEQIGQGEASTALAPTVIRALGPRDPVAMSRMAETLGVGEPATRSTWRRSALPPNSSGCSLRGPADPRVAARNFEGRTSRRPRLTR